MSIQPYEHGTVPMMGEWSSKHVFPGLTWREIESLLECTVRYCEGWRGNYMSGWCAGECDFY